MIKNHPHNFYVCIKKAINAGWSVILSSDGYANYGTGNVITSNNSGPNGFGNPNAWCVLSKTINNQQYQFVLQTDGHLGLRIKYSKMGFNDGMDNLGASPFAIDEEILIGSGNNIAPIYQQYTNANIMFDKEIVRISITTSDNIINFRLQPIPNPPRIMPVRLPIINKELK